MSTIGLSTLNGDNGSALNGDGGDDIVLFETPGDPMPANQPPVAVDDEFSTDEETPFSGSVFIDLDSDILETVLSGADASVDVESYRVRLAAGDPLDLTVGVMTPEIGGIGTLDLVLAQDLSGSFNDDIETLQTLAPDLFDAVLASGFDATFGVTSFSDKPIDPFGDPSVDFAYRTDLPLTDSRTDFLDTINGLSIAAGVDSPESQLEALLQISLREEEIGFRPGAARVVVLTTDANFHRAGDFSSAPPNNGDDVLDGVPPGTGEDYPSIVQVRDAVLNAGIVPIFAVTEGIAPVYEDLVTELGVGSVVILESDSSNIIPVIEESIEIATTTIEGAVAGDEFGFVSSFSPEEGFSDVEAGQKVEFTITLENTDLDAMADALTFSIPGFGAVEIDVELVIQDFDPDDDPLTVIAVDGDPTAIANTFALTSGATVAMASDGTFDYDPNNAFESLSEGETGTDKFTYTISDGNGGTDTATVTVTLSGVNDDPDGIDDSAETDKNTVLSAIDVLSNDTDIDASDSLTIDSLNIAGTLGLVTDNGDGTVSYDPNGQFDSLGKGQSATDSFTYTVSDGNGGTDTATVTVVINGVDVGIRVLDGKKTEGDSGPTPFTFNINRAGDLSGELTLKYTVEGTQADAMDFFGGTLPTGTVTFADGMGGNQVITIDVNGDLGPEPDETFQVSIMDITEETSSMSGTIAETAQDVSLSLTTLDRTDASTLDVSGTIAIGDAAGATQFNIVYVIDVSGSTDSDTFDNRAKFRGDTSVGDQNGDGNEDDIIDAEIAAFKVLTSSLVAADLGDQPLNIIAFEESVREEFEGLVNQDTDDNGVNDTNAFLESLQGGGTTNFEAPLQAAIEFLNAQAGGENFIYFLSDGDAQTGAILDEVSMLTNPDGLDATIRAIGLGNGANLNSLDLVDDGMDNDSAERVLDPASLEAGLTRSFIDPAEIDRLELSVNGTLVATLQPDELTNDLFGLSYSATLTGLDVSMDDTITSKVVFDDVSNTSIETSQTVEMLMGITPDAMGLIINDDGDANTSPVAEDDSFVSDVTVEDVVGTVLADNGNGADSDADGDMLSVTAVNGQAADVGSEVTLTNGSLLTLEADGSFLLIYDPAFDGLAPTDSVTESFTYTLEDGRGGSDTAMVTITVDGLMAGGLLGTSVGTIIDGDAGRDTIVGLSGNDLIRADGGRDLLFGSRGDDTLLGEDGFDTLNGGSGNDSLNGGASDDTVNGGAGDDTIQISNGLGFDHIDGGDGTDVLQASRNNLTLGLSSIRDVEVIDSQGFTNIRIVGTSAANSFDFSAVTLNGISSISGQSGADTIIGSAGGDNIQGNGGFDSLVGGDGNDTLEGVNANDTVEGGLGDDLILFDGQSTGRDVVDGGADNDTIQALRNNTVIGLESVENVETISGNGFANVSIVGGQGQTLFDFSGVTLTDIAFIDGSGGQDMLIGSAGDDDLRGGAGPDTLSGGMGNDTLRGDNGTDVFVIADGFDDDTIVDFDPVRERLDVSGITDVTDFDDLDTSGDGMVTEADALASQTVDGLVLTFASASVLIESVTALEEDNFIL